MFLCKTQYKLIIFTGKKLGSQEDMLAIYGGFLSRQIRG